MRTTFTRGLACLLAVGFLVAGCSSSSPSPSASPSVISSYETVSEPFTVTTVATPGKPATVSAKVGEPLLLAFDLGVDLDEGIGFRQAPTPDLLIPVIHGDGASEYDGTALPMRAVKAGRTTIAVYAIRDGKSDLSVVAGFDVTVTE